MKKIIAILIFGFIGTLIGKGCSYVVNQQVAKVDEKYEQNRELFAKKYTLIYLYTDSLKKMCEPSGYVPTTFIEDFKIQFASTIQENNKYIDNLKDFEIFQEELQILRNNADKENTEAYNLLVRVLQQKIGKTYTLKEYCQDMDTEKDKIIQKSKKLLNSYKSPQQTIPYQ